MRNILIIGAGLALIGCASTNSSAYGPSTSGSDLGFENRKIESDRFRVSYTGRNVNETQDYALLRAAQITLNEGYTHFKILGGGTSGNGPNAPVSTNIGVGTRIGGYGRGRTNLGVGVGLHDVARALEGSKVTDTIEIRLLNAGGQSPDIYDAKSITQNIRPAVFK